jgi:D-hydroxyproline dehydrogenase
MNSGDAIAVVGAGVIGSAIAYALAREGHEVLLVDRADPGIAGASFGNAGHLAAELLAPLPSRALLFGFWRELAAFGGPLEIPLRRLPAFLPWATRFAAAAFRREANTRSLAPLVRQSIGALERLLGDMRRRDLLQRHGHYEIWLGAGGTHRARLQAAAMQGLEVRTAPAPADLLAAVRRTARVAQAAGLWFPDCAHVIDPLDVVRAFASTATQCGASIVRAAVRAIRKESTGFALATDAGTLPARAVVMCAGVWSARLLEPLLGKARVPLEAARGYHVEMPGHAPLADAPLLYSDRSVLVTPMRGRLRASSFMEFRAPDAPADPRKPARLRAALGALGYAAAEGTAAWVGARPVLPDYLPAIGRLPELPDVFYAFGHQHIGLTLAGITAECMAALVAGRAPPVDLAPFALERFSG